MLAEFNEKQARRWWTWVTETHIFLNGLIVLFTYSDNVFCPFSASLTQEQAYNSKQQTSNAGSVIKTLKKDLKKPEKV